MAKDMQVVSVAEAYRDVYAWHFMVEMCLVDVFNAYLDREMSFIEEHTGKTFNNTRDMIEVDWDTWRATAIDAFCDRLNSLLDDVFDSDIVTVHPIIGNRYELMMCADEEAAARAGYPRKGGRWGEWIEHILGENESLYTAMTYAVEELECNGWADQVTTFKGELWDAWVEATEAEVNSWGKTHAHA